MWLTRKSRKATHDANTLAEQQRVLTEWLKTNEPQRLPMVMPEQEEPKEPQKRKPPQHTEEQKQHILSASAETRQKVQAEMEAQIKLDVQEFWASKDIKGAG